MIGDKLGAPATAFAAPPGSGPRHLLLERGGKLAYLLTELSAELFLLASTAGGTFTCADRVALLPEPFAGNNLGGHLDMHPLTGEVLVTNRGHDRIVTFAARGGGLRQKVWTFTGGASPCHFWSDGKVAIVAHEESGSVSLVSEGGAGYGQGRNQLGRPVAFANADRPSWAGPGQGASSTTVARRSLAGTPALGLRRGGRRREIALLPVGRAAIFCPQIS